MFKSNVPQNHLSIFERFTLMVKKYKTVIDTDSTAHRMVGFTAAALIRNEGDIGLESVEEWLQQQYFADINNNVYAPPNEETTVETNVSSKTDILLNVVSYTEAAGCISGDLIDVDNNDNTILEQYSDTESWTDKDDDETYYIQDNSSVYQLTQLVSRNPYSTVVAELSPVNSTATERASFNKSSKNSSRNGLFMLFCGSSSSSFTTVLS